MQEFGRSVVRGMVLGVMKGLLAAILFAFAVVILFVIGGLTYTGMFYVEPDFIMPIVLSMGGAALAGVFLWACIRKLS